MNKEVHGIGRVQNDLTISSDTNHQQLEYRMDPICRGRKLFSYKTLDLKN